MGAASAVENIKQAAVAAPRTILAMDVKYIRLSGRLCAQMRSALPTSANTVPERECQVSQDPGWIRSELM